MFNIESYLFKTNAIKFCSEDKPFWLTSGILSPYFINTHFVYGSEKEASEFLSFIDECLEDKLSLPNKVFTKVLKQYEENEIYHSVIDTMKNYISQNINVSEIDYISGGERRDWFFSNIIAYLLDIPHISIYKDLSCVVSDSKFTSTNDIQNIDGKKVLHIADLITVASSYIRAWIPTIRNLGGKMAWSCVVVDRMQGGKETIENEGVKSLSLVNVDYSLFESAYNQKIINEKQFDMLKNFLEDPYETMKQFLDTHPDFVEESLKGDERTVKRVKLMLEKDLYGLNS